MSHPKFWPLKMRSKLTSAWRSRNLPDAPDESSPCFASKMLLPISLLQIATLAFWALTGFAVVNAVCTTCTLAVLFWYRSKPSADGDLPRVAVLLCLRGADPNLADGLRRLMHQHYSSYEIFIAIDSDTDPAWDVVRRIVSPNHEQAARTTVPEDDSSKPNACQVHASTLADRLQTCSLKCSSLVQLLDQIDDSFEVVVLADSDLKSHSTWLRELVAPLADPRVGATFGNRWFLPTLGSMGSLVRQLCNGIGIVTMHLGQIPWGGSLAVRASMFKHSGLGDTLSRTIVDDGPIRAALRKQHLKLRFVPSLMMANREDCDLRFAHSFLTRQLKWTQTYMNECWPAMLVYTIGLLGTYLAALVMTVVCLLRGFFDEAFWFATGAAIYSANVMTLWLLLDFAARRIIRAQGEPATSIVGIQLIKIPLAMLISVVIHMSAMFRATFLRRVVWRGVTYEVHGPENVRLINDELAQAGPEASNLSL
jgi:cellulose synthase/poly-beta-1,6-N-acetylglucosamine synthase-like glycosyltransferase